MDELAEWIARAIGPYRGDVGDCVVDESILALGASIGSDALREAVAVAMPAALRAGVRAGAGGPSVRVDELYARVQQACGLRAGLAVEVVQLFFERLAEQLAPTVRAALRAELGSDWCALLVEPVPSAVGALQEPQARAQPVCEPMPAAADRPGSMRPLYAGPVATNTRPLERVPAPDPMDRRGPDQRDGAPARSGQRPNVTWDG